MLALEIGRLDSAVWRSEFFAFECLKGEHTLGIIVRSLGIIVRLECAAMVASGVVR